MPFNGHFNGRRRRLERLEAQARMRTEKDCERQQKAQSEKAIREEIMRLCETLYPEQVGHVSEIHQNMDRARDWRERLQIGLQDAFYCALMCVLEDRVSNRIQDGAESDSSPGST